MLPTAQSIQYLRCWWAAGCQELRSGGELCESVGLRADLGGVVGGIWRELSEYRERVLKVFRSSSGPRSPPFGSAGARRPLSGTEGLLSCDARHPVAPKAGSSKAYRLEANIGDWTGAL